MNYTKLKTGSDVFNEMMQEFGVVTVMNAKVYECDAAGTEDILAGLDAADIRDALLGTTPICTIDSLKIANITIEGPSKTISGGRYSNPLIKFGKSARIEMQDALGRAEAVQAFGGTLNQYADAELKTITAMHITEDFATPKMILGDSFFISRKTGQQVKVDIILYKVLPDSIFNLTQDAEGDATVFDLNGDLLTTEIAVPDSDGAEHPHGVFYSIIEHKDNADGVQLAAPVLPNAKIEEIKATVPETVKMAPAEQLVAGTKPAKKE